MIAVTVICIGKLKERFWRDACSEYEKRLSRFCSLSVRELSESTLSENPSQAEIDIALARESEAILKEIPKDAFCCALCIEGKELSSPQLAEKIQSLAANGKGKLCFIIGSSFGLSDKIKERCDLRLSFSKMTFPHQLFRTLLLEQLYRAFSIINSMKYHK
ncbi:MAG: 23S rRNA (pseudouridine(1915)-N(3))-methyltransferase RlmH [Oscillospiraceae bacterium]|nr:23S rRNA (pseudouridine(1915)-N(3))-methyltransferase RlmH [Oscillospiraceae bacterium]